MIRSVQEEIAVDETSGAGVAVTAHRLPRTLTNFNASVDDPCATPERGIAAAAEVR
jgi:hypothetical protein